MALEAKFVWAPDLAALYVIDETDISLQDVPSALKSKFLTAIREEQYAAQKRPPRSSVANIMTTNPNYFRSPHSKSEGNEGNGNGCDHHADDYVNTQTLDQAALDRKKDEAQYMTPSSIANKAIDEDDDYVNEEAIRLFSKLELGSNKNGKSAEEERDMDDPYMNAEAIELHTIDAHQIWMHGPLSRDEAVGRLKLANKSGTFLVRMKGGSGRLFAFSILMNASKGLVKHNLIQFFPNGTVTIDDKQMSKPCVSLKQVANVLCKLHEPNLLPKNAKAIGQVDYLIDTLQQTTQRWLRLKCTRAQAEHMLAKEEPGVFYIREASKGGLCFSVRLMGNKMFNGAITQTNFGFEVGKSNLFAQTLPELARAMMVDHSAMRKCGVLVKLKLSRIQ